MTLAGDSEPVQKAACTVCCFQRVLHLRQSLLCEDFGAIAWSQIMSC